MGGVPTPQLIAAVTGAGAMGALGAGPMPAEALAATLEQVRAFTQGPLAVNILVPFLDVDVVEVAAAGATVVDFYHGEPAAQLVELVHRHGSLAAWQVGSLADAEVAAQAGCDLLVVRGTEGGGRMHGSESLWPLLAEVLESVDVPVLAAGGIGDPRGMAGALAAGAAGVRMGTRFLAAAESGAHPVYRDAVIAASAADSVLTDDFREGWPDSRSSARVLRSSLDAARVFDGDVVGEVAMGPVTMPVPRFGVAPPLAGSTGAVEAMAMYAGESVRFVHQVEPAGEIVRQIAQGAERLLRAWC
jgi:NAD(P)H-dependent flavin oxidoreductase YrpB (nitropropane dioxygenase family)